MAFSCQIDGDILRMTAEGEYQLSDIKAAMQAAIEDPAFQPPMWFVMDARDSRVNPPVSEMLDTAAYGRHIKDQFHPQWIIQVSGSLHYGLGRMLALLLDPYGIDLRVCNEEAEIDDLLDEVRRAAGSRLEGP